MKYVIKEYDTRYFAGVELPDGVQSMDDIPKISGLWGDLFQNHITKIQNQKQPNHFIGLETYPFDFKETGTFYYFALAETNGLIEPTEGIVTKKLKPGKYICFTIEFDKISSQIQQVYNYIKENDIKVHVGFDYEDYLEGQDYGGKGALLDFCLMLENDS